MRQKVLNNVVCLIDVLGRAHPLFHIRKTSHLLTKTLQTIVGFEAESQRPILELNFWPSWPSIGNAYIKGII